MSWVQQCGWGLDLTGQSRHKMAAGLKALHSGVKPTARKATNDPSEVMQHPLGC